MGKDGGEQRDVKTKATGVPWSAAARRGLVFALQAPASSRRISPSWGKRPSDFLEKIRRPSCLTSKTPPAERISSTWASRPLRISADNLSARGP